MLQVVVDVLQTRYPDECPKLETGWHAARRSQHGICDPAHVSYSMGQIVGSVQVRTPPARTLAAKGYRVGITPDA